MPVRPILSKYPRLHALLRRDAQANTEFNEALLEVSKDGGASAIIGELQKDLETSEENLQKQIAQVGISQRSQERSVRFIRLFGELLEAQTSFKPYVDDLTYKNKYMIEFSPAQIRLALRLYWDIIGQAMESTIARTVVMDPAAEREGDIDDE